MVLIDGKATANQIKNEIAEEVKAITIEGRARTTFGGRSCWK